MRIKTDLVFCDINNISISILMLTTCSKCRGRGEYTLVNDQLNGIEMIHDMSPSDLREDYIRKAAYFISEKNPEWDDLRCWFQANDEIDQQYIFRQENCSCSTFGEPQGIILEKSKNSSFKGSSLTQLRKKYEIPATISFRSYKNHQEEWPSGLCKDCYPNNPPRYSIYDMRGQNYQGNDVPVYGSFGMLPRCSQPQGSINIEKTGDIYITFEERMIILFHSNIVKFYS